MIRIETLGEYNRVVLLGERRNAFSRQLIERLSGVDCDKDLVISNEGPVFSAGLDLSVFFYRAKTRCWSTYSACTGS
jgi:enoyl-CoA hydratase/carnithine racemase